MTDDDEDRSQETENRKRQRFAKKVHQDRHQDGGYDGAQGDDARNGNDDDPDGKDDERFPRGQEQDDAKAGSDAFPAFEFQKNRARMTVAGEVAAGDRELELIGRGSDAGLGGKLPQVDTEHPLSDVTDENQQAADGTEDTVGIGRPRIMTAVLAGIGMVQDLADDQAAGDRAYQIGQDQAEDTGHHKRSPSFLPRKMSRMGVPSKPKVSRSRFSKKRRYEKCMSWGSLTKRINVGGWTEAWVM